MRTLIALFIALALSQAALARGGGSNNNAGGGPPRLSATIATAAGRAA